jgi:hypothetical protein
LAAHDTAGRGPTVTGARLKDINDVFDRMKPGQIDGQIVIGYGNGS